MPVSLRIACTWVLAGLFCLTTAQAQTPVDSLHRQLPLLSGTARVSVYNAIGWAYKSSYPDSLLHYAELALQLAQELDDPAGEALSYNRLGWGWYLTSEGNRALDALHQAYQIAETHEIVLEQARACINLGIVHKGQANYGRAIRYHQKALQLSKRLSRQDWITMCHNNLGITYLQQGHLAEALGHYLTSLDLARQYAPMEIPKTYQNLGNLYFEWDSLDKAGLYFGRALHQYQQQAQPLLAIRCLNNLGLVALAQSDYTRADSLFTTGGELARKLESDQDEHQLLANLSLLYMQQEKWTLAEQTRLKSLAYWQSSENWEEVSRSWLSLAELAQQQEHYEEALVWLTKAYHLADSMNLYPLLLQTYQSLVEVCETLKQPEAALKWSKKALALSDSLHQWEMDEESYQQLLRFEAEQREHGWFMGRQEAQLQQTESSRQTWLGVASGALVLLLAGGFGFGLYRYKQRLRQLQQLEHVREEERKTIGHYLHDSTGVVFSVAQIYLDGVRKKLPANPALQEEFQQAHQLFNKAGQMVRTASHELHTGAFSKLGLEASLQAALEEVKLTTDLQVTYDLIGQEKWVGTTNRIFIHQTVKELLNNVLKHARAKSLYLLVMITKNQVKIRVTDDGIGLDETAQDFERGIGLSNLKQQAEARGGACTIEVANGTTVTVTFPPNLPKGVAL